MPTGEVSGECELGLQAHTVTNKATRALTKVLERAKRSAVAREAGSKFVRGKKEQESLVNELNGFQIANSKALKAKGRFSG